MKKYAGLLVLALLWGCNDRATSPDQSLLKETENASYGSSVVTLPVLPLAKTAAGSVEYKFGLTIYGDNMETMSFAWPVTNSGESFTIDKIPAGRSRMFEGILYGTNGVSYEGKAYADIIGGEVAYVSLVLRKTGAAQVEVIIEDGSSNNVLAGCYGLKGSINDIEMSPYTLQIPDSKNSEFWGYILRGDEQIGKCWGTVEGSILTAELTIPALKIEAVVSGHVAANGYEFKSETFSPYDKTPTGFLYGFKTDCRTTEPDCTSDTLSGPGSTSCKDTTTWIQYAAEACKGKGKVLTGYTFWSLCGDKEDPQFYEGVCFECCTPKK